jgi:hypothetical protein
VRNEQVRHARGQSRQQYEHGRDHGPLGQFLGLLGEAVGPIRIGIRAADQARARAGAVEEC